MVLLKIAVKDNKLIKVKDNLMIEDTINGIRCHFEFRSDWSDLKPKVAFARGHIYPATQNPQTIPALLDDNNECVVPPEIISERGGFSIGLFGEDDDTRIVTNWLYYKTQFGCYDVCVAPNPPTPSEYDKILGALNNKSNIDHKHNEYVTDEEMTVALKDKQNVIAENTYDKYGAATQALEEAKAYADSHDADTQYGIEYDAVSNKIKLVSDTSKDEVDINDFVHKGLDGISATHSWNGTVLTMTSASGTSSADLKGDKGERGEVGPKGDRGDTGPKGDTGAQGNDGYTPIKGKDYFDGKDGYTPIKGVDYFDGVKGDAGAPGKDGYSPVRGVDYFTDVDKQTIVADVLDNLTDTVTGARIGEVTLLADKWIGTNHLYSQIVSIEGVTKYSQVNLTPSVEQLAVFYEKDLTFVTENEDGVVTVYVIGQRPTNDYTIQTTMTEVSV